MSDKGNWVRAASAVEIAPGEMLGVEIGGRKVAIYHLEDGSWHATDNVCTHAFALLTEGWLEGCEIECPLHAGRFDVRTGAGLGAPIEEDIACFPVRLEGEDVMVCLPA
jgi:nitrite reductase/ring-hydroxylating ferredoxin subunit